MRKLRSVLFPLCLICVTVACGPRATPEVIRDMSRYNTLTAMARPTDMPSGPTLTPTDTPTPYTRPTDDPALSLDTPLVRIGEEAITLGQFRQRVRYERFAALASAARLVQQVGFAQLNLLQSAATPGANPNADQLAAIFNTLANSNSFGYQIYNLMLRESIIRQESHSRGLKVTADDIRGYWIRQLDLQTVPNLDQVMPGIQNQYITTAILYSGLSRADIDQIVETYLVSDQLRNLIAAENLTPVPAITVKLRHVLTASEADAQTVIKAIKGGSDFRAVACQYSIDPAARGSNGELGYVSRSSFIAGIQNADQVFNAKTGAIVGPLQSPLGWHVFRINGQRQTADGDTQIDAQAITVTTESLATDIAKQAQQGADFGTLACRYSLDKNVGNGGDLGYVKADFLGPEVGKVVQATSANGLVGPIATSKGFEVVSVDDHKLQIPKPSDLDTAKSTAFSAWQDRQASSSLVTTLSNIWQQSIPADPLPRDVSPLLREENFGLPTPAPSPTVTPSSATTSAIVSATFVAVPTVTPLP